MWGWRARAGLYISSPCSCCTTEHKSTHTHTSRGHCIGIFERKIYCHRDRGSPNCLQRSKRKEKGEAATNKSRRAQVLWLLPTQRITALAPRRATATAAAAVCAHSALLSSHHGIAKLWLCVACDRWLLSPDKILTPTASTLSPHKLDLIRVSHAMN